MCVYGRARARANPPCLSNPYRASRCLIVCLSSAPADLLRPPRPRLPLRPVRCPLPVPLPSPAPTFSLPPTRLRPRPFHCPRAAPHCTALPCAILRRPLVRRCWLISLAGARTHSRGTGRCGQGVLGARGEPALRDSRARLRVGYRQATADGLTAAPPLPAGAQSGVARWAGVGATSDHVYSELFRRV